MVNNLKKKLKQLEILKNIILGKKKIKKPRKYKSWIKIKK